MSRAGLRLRSSLLRDLRSGFSFGQATPPATQEKPKPDAAARQLGASDILPDSITSDNIQNRTRNIWLPASCWAAANGTPTFGAVGGNMNFAAWSMPNGVLSSIVALYRFPRDANIASNVQFNAYFVNLGAGAGNFVIQIQAGAYITGDNHNTNGTVVAGPTALAAAGQYLDAGWGIGLGTMAVTGLGPGVLSPFWHLQIKFERDGNSVSDTLANAIGFIGGEIQYTADM